MTGIGAFGPFALIVESGDGPAFLEPDSETARATLDWMRRIMDRREYRSLHFRELLGVEDWKANLIGMVATALHPRRQKFVPDLWQVVDRVSEASPQAVYLLRQIDPDFSESARSRLAGLCEERRPAGADEGEQSTEEARAHAAGRDVTRARSVAALLTMLASVAGEASWTEARQRDPEVAAVLQHLPLGDGVVTQWGARFEKLLGAKA